MKKLNPEMEGLAFIDEYRLLPAIVYALNENKSLMLTGDDEQGSLLTFTSVKEQERGG
jgi:hypothetical protein